MLKKIRHFPVNDGTGYSLDIMSKEEAFKLIENEKFEVVAIEHPVAGIAYVAENEAYQLWIEYWKLRKEVRSFEYRAYLWDKLNEKPLMDAGETTKEVFTEFLSFFDKIAINKDFRNNIRSQ